jgi:hypothetical protein
MCRGSRCRRATTRGQAGIWRTKGILFLDFFPLVSYVFFLFHLGQREKCVWARISALDSEDVAELDKRDVAYEQNDDCSDDF